MKRTMTALAAIGLFTTPSASAHDFWIEPMTYAPEASGPVKLSILTGHGDDKADWPVAPHRVVGLRSVGPTGMMSHVTGADSVRGDVAIMLPSEGMHMLFIETTNAFSSLPAEQFDDYVMEEGVLPIAAHRVRNGLEDEEGREIYSRRGKALVKVGCDGPDDPGVWQQPLGLTLEVVPGTNPFSWQPEDPFPVSVRFHGSPLGAAMLHVTQLDGDGGFTVKTDLDGNADLSGELSEGRWLVHTVWSEPADGLLNEADYQTVFSSLTFETEDACR